MVSAHIGRRPEAGLADSSQDSWFDRLLEELLPSLYRYALHLCRGRAADAEDLVQDSVLRALRSRDQIRSHDGGRPWLFRVVTTTHLNRVRTSSRRAESFAGDLDDGQFEEALATWTPMTNAEELLLRSLDWERVQQSLDQLAPEIKATVLLSDVEGFGQREIADMLGIPEGTVASRIFRGRRRLRALLGDGCAGRASQAGSMR